MKNLTRNFLLVSMMLMPMAPSVRAVLNHDAVTIINKVEKQSGRRVLFIGDSVTDGGWVKKKNKL